MSRLPPDVSRAVTHVIVEAIIDAPAQTVWDVILDFPAYPKWNTFVRYQAITDDSFRPLSTHSRPAEGTRILMRSRLPPRGLDDDDKGLRSAKDIITYIDEDKRRVVWEYVGWPSWLLKAERWQEVTEVQVDGKIVSKYISIEVFKGPGAWLIRWFILPNLRLSFEAVAEGLKNWSEKLAREY